MKRISKILAAAMAALTIASCSATAVGAVQTKPCAGVKVICQGADCGSLEKILRQLCKNTDFCLKQPAPAASEPATAPAVVPTEPVISPVQPSAPVPTDESAFNAADEAAVLRLVNNERAKYGLQPLAQTDGLTAVARVRAKEIVASFSHTRPNGSSCFTAAKEAGISYRAAGENIAYGYPSPEAVVNGWMNSEGHRKNILSPSFGKLGIGCYQNGGVLYWTQFFTD